jgi:hypothetical protein
MMKDEKNLEIIDAQLPGFGSDQTKSEMSETELKRKAARDRQVEK